MTPSATTARSLYRRFLRELPVRPPQARRAGESILSHPSPLQQRIRTSISTTPESTAASRLQEADQMIQYVQAQRMYTTLLERYNPGMNMNEEERVRLTARRVGMDLPPELQGKK